MKFEDEAKLILEAVTKTATSKRNRERALQLGGRVAKEVKTVGFRLLSDIADRISSSEANPFDPEIKPSISKPVSSREYAARHFAQSAGANKSTTIEESRKSDEDTSNFKASVARNRTEHSKSREIPKDESGSQIPEKKYGINRAVLLIRRPDQAFAYWEIDEERIPETKYCGLELINEETNAVISEATVSAQQGKHYFTLTNPHPSYVVELYVEKPDGTRERLSRSKPAKYQEGNPTGSQRPTKSKS
ncbi:MAG: DUF4912 domain-containing protein [Myxococcota bacterium]|nr:DUF4912 domain-containing protein [Myxococcota bacterium]